MGAPGPLSNFQSIYGSFPRLRRTISKAAILDLTSDNKTQEIALKLLEQDADDLPAQQANLITTERHFALTLAKQIGGDTAHNILSRMSHREFVQHRAANLIEQAQNKLIDAYQQKQAAQQRRFGRRGRRRR